MLQTKLTQACSLKSHTEYEMWQIQKTSIRINSNLVRLMAVFTTKLRKTHNTHIDKLMTGKKKKDTAKNKIKHY